MSGEEASYKKVIQETEGGRYPLDSANAPAWSVIEELERDSISE
jgi:hypothetical protein